MRKITIGFVIVIGMFLLASSVKGASYNVSYTGFLSTGELGYIDTFDFETGDKIFWSFRTFDNSFNVSLHKGPTFLSYGKTSDSGYFSVLNLPSTVIYLTNIDTIESGSYELTISVNPTSPSISGFNFFILFGVISLTAIILKKKLNKRYFRND